MRQADTHNYILVTGASGMVGRAIAEKALSENWAQKGWKLKLQVRKQQSLSAVLAGRFDPKLFEIIEVDFTQMSDTQLERLLRGVGVVVHCGGAVHQPDAPFTEFELVNIRATEALAKAAAKAGCTDFIFFSTSGVYGAGPFTNISEHEPTAPATPYAVSKLRSELWLKDFNSIKNRIVFRPSLIFGPGDRGNLLSLIKQINKKRYFNIGSQAAHKSIVCAADVALAVELCLSKLAEGFRIFNIANPEPVLLDKLSADIALSLGHSAKIPTLPAALAKAGAGALQAMLKEKSPVTVMQIEKLTTTTTLSVKSLIDATGFSPKCELIESLKEEVEWARKANLLT